MFLLGKMDLNCGHSNLGQEVVNVDCYLKKGSGNKSSKCDCSNYKICDFYLNFLAKDLPKESKLEKDL